VRPSPAKPYSRELEFTAMVREHQTELWRYLRYLGCEGGLADDLVQETFLAVWRKPFDDRGAPATRAYLRTVARNLFLMAVRRARVRPAFRELREADHAWEEHAGDDGGAAYREALRRCLAGVKPRPRQALMLFYRDRRSRTDIADELRMTANGIKTLLRRTREALRDCIRRRLGA
jgi:RNA polymerase sigma-70 factor (ECF subfamily)